MSSILKNFNIFRDFTPNIVQNITTFFVSDYFSGFCVTKDKKVYGLGKNIHQILGYNKVNDTTNCLLITQLCDENVQEFYQVFDRNSNTGKCIFARNDHNQIFGWGQNDFGLLGRGYRSVEYLKPQKFDFFDGKNIIQISCGFTYCLALSSEGVVYGWGDNRFGQIGCGKEREIILIPIPIDLKTTIKSIYCSKNLSVVVTVDGNSYYWGSNVFTPKLLPLKSVSKIYDYSGFDFIILDNNGIIFIFNVLKGEIFEIRCEDISKFNDLYCDEYYCCLLQTDNCVYQLDHQFKTRLVKTDFINFFDFYSQKLDKFKKTIHITSDGYLMKKEIHFNENENILILKDEYVFNRKYDNTFDEIDEIGSGGFGDVFLVKHKLDNFLYAIKRVEIKSELDYKEIQIMSKLNSDFVVQFIDSWIEGIIILKKIKKFLFIQMELCSHNLRDFIIFLNNKFDQRFKTINYFISCELFRELTECVNYLHSIYIIHRDLKPENILISDGSNGRFLKLCDFGLAKVHQMSVHTRGQGTLAYMAPEVSNTNNYNTKSDIYSLALIATEIFRFEDSIRKIRIHKNRKDFNKYLSKYLNTILEKKYRKLLKTLSNCLLPKDYHSRPDSKKLLIKINEFCVDMNIVLNDENILRFESFLENQENMFLKKFFKTKISNNNSIVCLNSGNCFPWSIQ